MDPFRDQEIHLRGTGVKLSSIEHRILEKGLQKLVSITQGMKWKELPSIKFPFPIRSAYYLNEPNLDEIRDLIENRLHSNPISVLEQSLVLLELFESNQPDKQKYFLEDMPFVRTCFATKRQNGWIACIGDSDRERIEDIINDQWKFKFFSGRKTETGIYVLLSMLTRYAFIYGRIPVGDGHALTHFVEDHCPGLLVCQGKMSALELTLSLAAMKMGVPAVVSTDYPFSLGNSIRINNLEEISEAVVGFRNIRRMLKVPEIPQLPDYCDLRHKYEKFSPAKVWGNTSESFYILRKGLVEKTGVFIIGSASTSMGIVITVNAEPLDAIDCHFIESHIISAISMIKGVQADYNGTNLQILFAENIEKDPKIIGETLIASLRHEFPLLQEIKIEIIFEKSLLAELNQSIREEKIRREKEIASTSEESIDRFYRCLSCATFAPDHICIITPERAPQCGKSFGRIKTGALYTYDEMSNIHHNWLHRDSNVYGTIEKGTQLNPITGEWAGINVSAAKLTHGRTNRIFLHSLDKYPHTGCGCFRFIMFKTNLPRIGIGIMDRAYKGSAPDGRTWTDLHYELAGKQVPGVTGGSTEYLFSEKFLIAHKGWQRVVWVSPKIAKIAKDFIVEGIQVGPEF